MLLNNRYDLGKEIGAGGMGTVYLAVDTTTDGQVAIKALKPDVLASEQVWLTVSNVKPKPCVC